MFGEYVPHPRYTFPKTNSSPLKLGHPKRKGSFFLIGLPSLKLTAQPLKIDGWKMNFPFGARPISKKVSC